jgi:hypothetical protein
MSNPGTYWVVAVPNEEKDEEKLRSALRKATAGNATVLPFSLPQGDLKIGTLDSLVTLGDTLVKTDAYVAGVVKRISKTYHDVYQHDRKDLLEGKRNASQGKPDKKSGLSETPSLKVEMFLNSPEPVYVTREEFVTKFRWWERRYALKTQLPAIAATIEKATEK